MVCSLGSLPLMMFPEKNAKPVFLNNNYNYKFLVNTKYGTEIILFSGIQLVSIL